MLKIGEFSRLGQVTIKTLHHYESLGLLQPVHIDPSSGYRFYSVEQLTRLHRILALKELGLSLEQIGLMLDEEMPTEQIRGMLRLKQGEINQQLQEAQKQLAMVEFRLRMIEAEINFPELDVVIKNLEPMRCLSMFVPPPPTPEDGMRMRARVAGALNKAIAEGTIQHTGVAIDIFHGETILPFESPELGDQQHEILLGVTDSQEAVTLEEIGHWVIREVPAVKTAATLMIARDDSGFEGYEKAILLRRWAIAHGYQPHNMMRFLHLRGPLQTLNREDFIAEAQLPLDMAD